MKKILMFILMMGLLTSASALSSQDVSNSGFDDLTVQQQADVLKTIADKAQEAKVAVPNTAAIDEAQKWVNLGSSIGKGLASSARELGVAVNDFSNTSVGKWTMFLIVFNIVGSSIIHIIGGLLFLFFGITFTTVILNRKNPITINYQDGKVISKVREKLSDDVAGPFWFAYIIIIAVSIVIMITG